MSNTPTQRPYAEVCHELVRTDYEPVAARAQQPSPDLIQEAIAEMRWKQSSFKPTAKPSTEDKSPMSKESLPLIAATEWARAHASTSNNPVIFGRNVAHVYLGAQVAQHHTNSDSDVAAEMLIAAGFMPRPLPPSLDAGSPPPAPVETPPRRPSPQSPCGALLHPRSSEESLQCPGCPSREAQSPKA